MEEAIRIFEHIPAERMHGIKAIGIRVEDSCDPDIYDEVDVVVGKHMDFEMLQYYPDITENEKAMDMVRELHSKMPEMEVRGEVPEVQVQEQVNRPRRHR